MKAVKSVFMIAVALMMTANLHAGQKPEKAKFKVYGKCDMCETRIEKAAKSLDGVVKVRWDVLSKKIKVKYYPEKVSLDDIHKKIAEVGHDTEKETATDEAYANLHHCCKYERKKE